MTIIEFKKVLIQRVLLLTVLHPPLRAEKVDMSPDYLKGKLDAWEYPEGQMVE